MDPIFATVVLGFFALIIALVSVLYSKDNIAHEAIKYFHQLSEYRRNDGNNLIQTQEELLIRPEIKKSQDPSEN